MIIVSDRPHERRGRNKAARETGRKRRSCAGGLIESGRAQWPLNGQRGRIWKDWRCDANERRRLVLMEAHKRAYYPAQKETSQLVRAGAAWSARLGPGSRWFAACSPTGFSAANRMGAVNKRLWRPFALARRSGARQPPAARLREASRSEAKRSGANGMARGPKSHSI